ncbi:MAG TPA: HAMP domain-containing sensor histidine kinase [Anaerolineales bacterium]|nr:HAMP domain-containing sensor histidine kinase [Anaerolineales bacterium]
MKRSWFLLLLPGILGLLLKFTFERGWLENSVVYLRIDLGTLALLLGITLTILLFIIWGIFIWQDRQFNQEFLQFQATAAEERRQFLRRLDHELKNPLTAIQAGLVNLEDDGNEAAIQSIKTQTQRLSRLVADLRKLAELETRPIERAPVDLTAVLEETVAIVQEDPEANERSISLSLPQAPWPLPEVQGDEDLLLLALINLLSNAVKFSGPGSRIEVRAFEDAEMVIIEVADTGPGIPEAEVPFVWQELYRGRSARGVPGSGLGLALVRAITERHGGQVSIRSRIQQGTVVTMKLPIGEVTKP